MSAGSYVARIVDVPGQGIRLEPAEDSVSPDQPTETNLLAMSAALALGAAGYRHHPEPRDADLQTLDALLAGEVVMPWVSTTPTATDTYLVCILDGTPRCHLEHRAG
jgi:hypothetical protein